MQLSLLDTIVRIRTIIAVKCCEDFTLSAAKMSKDLTANKVCAVYSSEDDSSELYL